MKPVSEFDKAVAQRLQRFLAAPGRPAGTMSYHELAGFLYTLACAPEMVPPSKWLPLVFDGEEAGYTNEKEAQTAIADIMTYYNHVNEQVMDGRPTLPADCEIRTPAIANLDDHAPLSHWARGFLGGHDWLMKLWEAYTPESFDEELGSCMMVLGFFASRQFAEGIWQEASTDERQSLDEMAEVMAGVLPEALAQYAHLGWSIRQVLAEQAETDRTPVRAEKTGRNDPCPCGSGKKYKKCCGAMH